MKKIVAITMAAIMGIGLFSLVGCGKNEKESGKKTTNANSENSTKKTVIAENEEKIKIDMSTPKTARETYKKAIESLSDKEILEFSLTMWFEINKIIPSNSTFQVAIKYWNGKNLQERIALVKSKYPDEFSEKYAKNMERSKGRLTPEFFQNARGERGIMKRINKMISENDNGNNQWDNSGKIYFR